MHKISVAILSYNRKEFLKEALLSILAQTEKNIEIVLFDNGSSFNVDDVVDEVKENILPEHSIKTERNEKNIGSVDQYAKTQECAFGAPYLMVFHDDDTLHPEYVKSCLDILEGDNDIDWVGSNIRFVKDNAEMATFEECSARSFFKVDCNGLMKKLFQNFNLGFSSIVFRTEVFQKRTKINIFAEQFNKWFDRPFIISLLGEGKKVALANDKFMNYRIHPSQDSKKFDNTAKKYLLQLSEYYKSKTSRETLPLYDKWAFNNTVLIAKNASSDRKQFITFLANLRSEGYLPFKGVNLRGAYYILRSLCRI